MPDLRASLDAASAAGALRRVSFRPDAANDFIVIIIIVRSHLGSSVRVACEGRLLTNDVRGFTNRDVD